MKDRRWFLWCSANFYTRGHSEQIIGDYVRVRSLRRDQLVIATKFFANLFPGDPNGGGASRKSVAAACDESLRRLQTDYIDLYWMHVWDRFYTDRGDHAGTRRPRCCRESALHWLLGYASLDDHPGTDGRHVSGMDAVGGAPD